MANGGMLGKVSNKISSLMVWLGSVCMLGMVGGQTYEVVLRYMFRKSTGVMDEIVSLGLVGIMVTGIGYTLKQDSHVRITMLTDRLDPRTRNGLKLVMSSISLVCCLLAAYYLFDLSIDSFRNKVRSLSPLSTSLFVPQAALGGGFALLSLELVRDILGCIEFLFKKP